MHSLSHGVRTHKVRGAVVAFLGFFAVAAAVVAQTAAPSAPASAPSEAARRAAESPYRFILQNGAIRERAKPAPAAQPEKEVRETKRAPEKDTIASVPARPAVAAPAPEPERAAPPPAPVATPVAVAIPQAKPAAVVAARKELIPIKQDPPELSVALLREQPKGTVTVAFDVNTDGSVTGVKVTHSTNIKLNRPSVTAITGWKFQPLDEPKQLEIELNYN